MGSEYWSKIYQAPKNISYVIVSCGSSEQNILGPSFLEQSNVTEETYKRLLRYYAFLKTSHLPGKRDISTGWCLFKLRHFCRSVLRPKIFDPLDGEKLIHFYGQLAYLIYHARTTFYGIFWRILVSLNLLKTFLIERKTWEEQTKLLTKIH